MAVDVRNRTLSFEDSGVQRIGIGTECPSAILFVHEGSASTAETGNSPPECWFEVRF